MVTVHVMSDYVKRGQRNQLNRFAVVNESPKKYKLKQKDLIDKTILELTV